MLDVGRLEYLTTDLTQWSVILLRQLSKRESYKPVTTRLQTGEREQSRNRALIFFFKYLDQLKIFEYPLNIEYVS